MNPAERPLLSGNPVLSPIPMVTHAVQFYETDAFLMDVVGRYTAEGLLLGQPVLLVATAEHAAGVLTRLGEAGLDAASAVASGDIVVRDAGAVLKLFMSGPLVDPRRCRDVLAAELDALFAGRSQGTRVRVFGEMVDLLWRDGHSVAALQVEEIWNELTAQYPLTLVCGYAMSNFARAEHDRAFDRVCCEHAHVLPAEGFTDLDAEARDREVNRLRQRAHSLEAEIERRAALERALRDALASRRRSEDALRQAKESAERASQAKTEFLAVMSHELRTPLNAIFGYEDLLRAQLAGPLTERQQQYLDRLRQSADQLLSLVNEVLQLSRIEAGREDLHVEPVVPAVLAAAALESIEPMAAGKGLRLALDDRTAGLQIRTDAGKLRQILLNLLSNAAKFTAEGFVQVTIRRSDDAVCIDVSDTGIGICDEQIERIFEPFTQADSSTTRTYGGSGLGLAVSRHLAELLGGSLSVRSAPQRGSTFTLLVPLS